MGLMALASAPRAAGAAPNGLPFAGRVIRSGLARAFGPAPFDPGAAPGDPGLLGPTSASWDVIAEPAAIVGGIRALLVQLLHPLAMAGVADHSRFRDDALGRLQRTSAYVTATTFGSTDEALAAVRLVRRVHQRVVGVAPDGRPYRADDPPLLAWVSIALTSSFLATDRAYAVRRLPSARADDFVAEQSFIGALLDPRVDLDAIPADALRRRDVSLPLLEDGLLPTTVAGLDAALRRFSPEWTLNEQGREALRFLRWPAVPAPLRMAYVPLFAGAVASLDPRQRAVLGVRMGPAAGAVRLQTRATIAGMRLAVGVSPSLQAAQRRAAATPYHP